MVVPFSHTEVIPMLVEINNQQAATDARPADNAPRPSKTRSRKDMEPIILLLPARTTRNRWYGPCKRAVEFTGALVLLVLTAPLIGLAALLVKLTSSGPAFYTQTRVGQGGRLFTIYKVRTMIDNCESLTGPRWAIPGDPRVTWLGKLLRVSHLDELPQLVNVLRGDMSLIGPRPERPEFVGELERALPAYRQRLAIRPGVTGLAQVQLPADTDLDSVRRKLAYDLYYVEHVSPWLDLRLVLCTCGYILGIPFRISRRLLRIPGEEQAQGQIPTAVIETSLRPRKCA
jgi:lipopolysaccharide/colanic/teichoic acid biosynthesis glycosyltransferase